MRTSKERPATPSPESPPAAEARESREQDAEKLGRETLRAILDLEALEPATALEVVAAYDPSAATNERLEDLRLTAADFGLELDGLDPVTRNELITLYAATDKVASEGGKAEVARAMNEIMREKLMATAFSKVDGMREALVSSKDAEELKDRYRDVMRALTDLARQMPPDVADGDKLWRGLYGRMRDAIELKNKEGVMPQAVEALKSVAAEFEDEIEDEFVSRELARLVASGQPHSVEHLMRKVYGRTPEEVEELKSRNRKEVAAEILRLKDDPEISIETLERLHAINNRGIVPKDLSRLRQGNEGITFGQRFGLLPDDLKPEMEALLARAEALIGREIVKGVSDPVFQIAAAKMHNDLLDIHPFSDRNGSTAMLFLELIMSKKGYVPDEERPESYYGHLREVLGSNPVAMGIVTYEHYKIRHKSGHYEGETIMKDPKKAAFYARASKHVSKQVLQRRKEAKAEKRSKKP